MALSGLWCNHHALALAFQGSVPRPAPPSALSDPLALCPHFQSSQGCLSLWACSCLCYPLVLKSPSGALYSIQELMPLQAPLCPFLGQAPPSCPPHTDLSLALIPLFGNESF